jgi:hypothetical protein
MREWKSESINWQGTLKQKDIKHTGIKERQSVLCFVDIHNFIQKVLLFTL